jgi:hypothetical protein
LRSGADYAPVLDKRLLPAIRRLVPGSRPKTMKIGIIASDHGQNFS